MKSPSTLLVVQNLQVSQEFYVNVLGLDLVEEHSDCIKLKAGHHEVIMFQGTMESTEYKHGYNANSTLLFIVNDLDNKINDFKSRGVVFIHERPNKNRWGRYAAFKDPSGIIHELFELCT
jgi:glyoxylase I family protein